LVVVITGAALIQATLDFPTFADPQAPANLHVAPRYLEESGREIGIPNVVTSVLASYRGYDTLGETTVIFTAGIAVLMLMGRARGERPPPRNGGGTGGNEGAPRRRED
ncbi:MAG TPA: hydrogen gas-evolving membrane-bound hydrogenase subunit E, partial [Alphaproteobacteria bacterium]|nr:hydrogen gas-evolving membrane-bound hydrogenase subunit E [Alphaproteobacteria bacterium]